MTERSRTFLERSQWQNQTGICAAIRRTTLREACASRHPGGQILRFPLKPFKRITVILNGEEVEGGPLFGPLQPMINL